MLAVRIPEKMETRLDQLAALTGRAKSYYVREALQAHLDEIEESYTALYRLVVLVLKIAHRREVYEE